MNSLKDTSKEVGFPIRKSPDQSLLELAAPRGLSQLSMSFIVSQCQGIHRKPLVAYFLPNILHLAKPIGFNQDENPFVKFEFNV